MTQTISSLPAVFLQMKNADEFVDITLVFGKQRIACHKVILAGMCDYFRRMFQTSMLERGSQELVLNDISASTGVLLVDYLYSGNIVINQHNAQDLLAASEMLLLGALKKNVEDFLLSHTDSVNCISIINLARLYDLKKLLVDARNYLHEHVKEVIETEEMHLLQEADLIEALEANASHEENFLFIQKWMRSADGRTDRFDDLMQHVSLSQCSKDFVCRTVMEEKLMLSTRGMKFLQQFMQSYGSADPPKQPSLAVGNEIGEMWLCTDLNTPQWQPIQQPELQNKYYSACASPGGFVVSGGQSQNGIQHECYSYDAQNGHWNTLPPMPTARRWHSSIYHNHHLYVVAGCDRGDLNSVEALDMRSLQWNHLPPLPRKVRFAYLAIVSDNLFVLGGCYGDWVADVHEFDSTQQTWRQRSPMPEICVAGAAVSFNDHVYVVGGENRSCMRFNPRNNTWTSLQRPQFSHQYGPSLVLNGNIVVFGGFNPISIEEYSPRTDSWSTCTLKMPPKSVTRSWAFAARMDS
ncbi:hypothetical protein CAPTEDRAFT_199969 [Capitella teleta]|uniref:BTB domain-containing protein n=1 Tax=Capitella teleta TaxID=283909 RepID=R7TL11_CAPTE|nr:hypothetical protein CAPTEDRAFT_199969 [Capitella teleta]|eukprot:ELT92246.1 hypothetical protein CAPTEDRAFT_199969 [Capitella teleta]